MILKRNSKFFWIYILTLTVIIHEVSLQECTQIPASTRDILNSVIYSSGSTIPGFQTFDLDAISYTFTYNNPVDQNPETGVDSFECRTATTVLCGPVYSCCLASGEAIITNTTEEKNWLVSAHYMTDAEVIQVQVLCDILSIYPVPDCRNTSRVYYYESDNAVTIDSAILSEFSLASNSINQSVNDGLIHASFTKTKKGFYIGIMNNGYCAQISTVQIFYFICPSISINQLNSLPETPVPRVSEEPTVYNLSCPVGSVSLQRAECYSNGSWRVPEYVECMCERGWSEVASSPTCIACPENSYKKAFGNDSECVACPEMSGTNGSTGSVLCGCDVGWYRSEEESVNLLCGRSPSAVRNVRLERGTAGSGEESSGIRVAWDEPVDVWNRPVSYNVSLYSDGLWWSGRSERLWYELTESELGGSNREYLLEVTSLNSLAVLSGVENSVSVRFVSAFPEVVSESLRLNGTSSELEWEYQLEGGVSELRFELNYTSIGGVMRQEIVNGCSPVSTFLYKCSVAVIELNVSIDIVLTLLPLSSNGFGGKLSRSFNLDALTTSQPTNPSQSISVAFIIAPTIVILLLFISIVGLLIGLYLYRRKQKSSSFDYHFDSKSYPLEKLYQDPGLYNDLNTAVRRFAKEINHEDLQFLENIGEGEFADVCKGILKKQEQRIEVAIKILKSNALQKNKEDFLSEASIMGQFKHPNVIFLYGVTLNKPIVIVTPFMENGSLDDFLAQKEFSLTAIQQVAICIGVASGMEYFTKIGFVHRDLAARNVLIDSDWTPKISDFGLSRETEESFYNVRTGGKIPIRWTAPEAIAYRKFNEASDVWSFGVLMWEVTSYAKTPYSGIENFDVLGEVQAGYRLEKPDFCPDSLYDLMLFCWKSDCELRPKFTDIKIQLNTLVENNFGTRAKNRQNRASFIDPKACSLDAWLDSINFSRYIVNFQEGGYCYLAQIYSLTSEDLIKLGIIPIGHRTKILNSISELHRMMLQQVNLV